MDATHLHVYSNLQNGSFVSEPLLLPIPKLASTCSWQRSSITPLGLMVSPQLLLGSGKAVLPLPKAAIYVLFWEAQYEMRPQNSPFVPSSDYQSSPVDYNSYVELFIRSVGQSYKRASI